MFAHGRRRNRPGTRGRTVVGLPDGGRGRTASITYFTEGDVEQLYLRSDLDQTADLVGFAEHERLGFHSQSAYRNTQLGEYQATIRMFENGFLSRVIRGGHGVWVTTDHMSIERFEELSSALESVLEDHEVTAVGEE